MQQPCTPVSNLEAISAWGTQNSVRFESMKVQFLHISLERNIPNFQLLSERSRLQPEECVNIPGAFLMF